MNAQPNRILDHNQIAAATWSAGGKAYDDVSFAISDALTHAAQRLNAKPAEQVLDVATGTGWTARNVARSGACVTAVDIAADLLAAAQGFSIHITPRIDYLLADAENLPFASGRFDRVISTFGVMFAADPPAAARELGRVCRKGGRLSLATWAPDGAVARFFAVLASHNPSAPPNAAPLSWGDPLYVETLLGRDFTLRFERGISHSYFDSADDIWDWYLRGFGPLRALHASLEAPAQAALEKDVADYHRHYATECGLHVQREYLVTIGKRR